MTSEIEKAYKYCESITKTHAKSFYFAAKFLPKSKRKPIYALYALCRHVDDEVDEAEARSKIEAVEAVGRWKQELEAVYKDELRMTNGELRVKTTKDQRPKTKDQNSVLLAWSDLLKNYKIPQNLPLELMTGVLQDTHTKRYETFEELYIYCYRVASTVGLMSSEIFGYSDEKTLEYAEALGIAMQLTNILRDVKEDAAMDRIYLPQEDLHKFNVTERQILDGEMNENFTEMMDFQIKRARNYYRKAEQGIAFLEKDTRFTVLLALRLYSRILDEIEKQNYNVFLKRAHINFRKKVFSIPNIWIQSRSL
jgi:phytoene synthase